MSDINMRSMPVLGDDKTLESLIETFNARVIQAETKTHYIGNLTLQVQVGESEFLTLPSVRLIYACHKAELERARATLFASHLLQMGRESARDLWQRVAPWEGKDFMAWVKLDIEWKRGQRIAL